MLNEIRIIGDNNCQMNIIVHLNVLTLDVVRSFVRLTVFYRNLIKFHTKIMSKNTMFLTVLKINCNICILYISIIFLVFVFK